jgi:hypothetical protein
MPAIIKYHPRNATRSDIAHWALRESTTSWHERLEENCWLFKPETKPSGPALVWVGSTGGGSDHAVLVTRLVYSVFRGDIRVGALVRHACDRPKCVRPSHLLTGTSKDNAQDRESRSRGRQPQGEQSGASKLTNGDVEEIRRLYATGEWILKRLAERFGISISGISRIVRRAGWKHIP